MNQGGIVVDSPYSDHSQEIRVNERLPRFIAYSSTQIWTGLPEICGSLGRGKIRNYLSGKLCREVLETRHCEVVRNEDEIRLEKP